MMNTTPGQHNALRLFGFTFCVTSSYIICRIVADSLLLTRLGTVALPPMLVLSALAVGSVTFVWTRRTHDVPLNGLILSTQLSGAMATIVLVLLMRIWPHSMFVICSIYILAELRACFNAIQLAVLLNENLCSRSEQQKFALVNAASPVAGITVGMFLGAEARIIAPAMLLAGTGVLDILSILAIRKTTRGLRIPDAVHRLSTHDVPTTVLTTDRLVSDSVRSTRLFARAILRMVVCQTAVLAIVTFEWKVFASRVFPNNEGAHAAYFGMFYAVSDALILILQLITARFLRKSVGVSFCILVLPIYLTILGIISLCTHHPLVLFWVLTAARGSHVIRWGIHQIGVQILYGTLPTIVRRGTVAKILGIAKPAAEAVSAGCIGLLVLYMPVRTFAWFWLPVMVVWLWWSARIVTEWSQLDRNSGDVPVKPSDVPGMES